MTIGKELFVLLPVNLCQRVSNHDFLLDFVHKLALQLVYNFMYLLVYSLCVSFICMRLLFLRLATKTLFLMIVVTAVIVIVCLECYCDNEMTFLHTNPLVF